jgi:Lysozyme like domain
MKKHQIVYLVLVAVLVLVGVKLYRDNRNLKLKRTEHSIVKAESMAMEATEKPVAVVEPETVEVSEPVVETIVEPVQEPQVAQVVGDCASEIAKYDWDYQTAYNVMMAESGGRYWEVNNTPATGDYSVGCFQVNLYGNNARNRPSEEQLKIPSVNVQWAYNNYVSNGRSFIGQWGVCRDKVQCY